MDFEKLDGIARELMARRKAQRERETGSTYEHGVRTAKLALLLRRELMPDDDSMDDILHLAGLFHDVAKSVEPHEKFGPVLLMEAVQGLVTEAEAREAARLISEHCDRRPGEPYPDVWSKILQDADLLDHIGSYTVWMDIQRAAFRDLSVEQTAQHFRENARAYAEYHRKTLNFPVSVRIYDERIASYLDFAERFCVEAEGEIYHPERIFGRGE